ncbi:MAG: ATP-binding protein, partial [Actinomycetota bacterium]
AGVSLAGLLLSPRRMWPWIIGFVGIVEFGLNMAHHSGWGLALTFSLANTVEPVMSAFIVMAICGPTFVLQRVRHILALTFAGCVSPMVSASIAAAGASAAGLASFWSWWRMWWAGDLVGGLAVAAALVAWRSHTKRPRLRPQILFVLWVGGVVCVIAYVLVGDQVPIAFLLAPVLVFIAVRAGSAVVGVAALGLAALGEYSAWKHVGPLAGSYSRSTTIGLTPVFVGASLFLMLVLNAASAQAEELDAEAHELESIGALAKGVAHDINHLLGLILSNCELLSTQLDVRGPQWDALERIVQGAERTSMIVRQLQVVSSTIDRSIRADLNVVVRRLEPLLQSAAGNCTLKISLSETPCEVRVKSSDVEQVLLNLVLNARDAAGESGTILGSTYATSEGSREGRHAVLTVVDDGTGMDDQALVHVFDAWFKNTPDRSRSVGLPHVRSIVELGGGLIEIKSRLGAGTAVRVKWPMQTLAPENPLTVSIENRAPVFIGGGLNPTVIIVASDQVLGAHLLELLSGRGHRLVRVTNASEALVLSRSLGRVGAAVIEVGLMGINGIALTRRLLAEQPDLPILLLGDLSSLPSNFLPERAGWTPLPPDDAV